MQNKLFAIPSGAIQPRGDQLVLNVDKEKLAQAPGFEKGNWPDMANQEWGTPVHLFYVWHPAVLGDHSAPGDSAVA